MAKLHAELGFMHECLVVFSFFGSGSEELLEREPLLSALLEDFHDDGRGTGMDGADVAIVADSIVADRIDLSRQGPLRTEQMRSGSDCLAERFGVSSETRRFDFQHIKLSYQKPKLLRTSGVVTWCDRDGFASRGAALKTGVLSTDLLVARDAARHPSFLRVRSARA